MSMNRPVKILSTIFLPHVGHLSATSVSCFSRVAACRTQRYGYCDRMIEWIINRWNALQLFGKRPRQRRNGTDRSRREDSSVDIVTHEDRLMAIQLRSSRRRRGKRGRMQLQACPGPRSRNGVRLIIPLGGRTLRLAEHGERWLICLLGFRQRIDRVLRMLFDSSSSIDSLIGVLWIERRREKRLFGIDYTI